MADDRCHDCDKLLATPVDFDAMKEGEGEHLCWRAWNDDTCIGDPVDWRARALRAESALGEAAVALEATARYMPSDNPPDVLALASRLRTLTESPE